MTDRYTQPPPGTENWHEPLNENFATLSRDVEYRDVAANRSEYDPERDAKFFALDTGAISVGDGDEWIHVTTTGAEPAVDSLTADTAALTSGTIDSRPTSADDITPKSYVDEVSSGRTMEHGIVYASENVESLPSIQDAVDRLGTGRDDANAVYVVGGENVIDEPVDLSGINEPDSPGDDYLGEVEPLEFKTIGARLTRDPDAEMDAVIDLGGSFFHLDVDIDAGGSPTHGIRCFQQRNPSHIVADVQRANQGVAIQDHSERLKVRVYAKDCYVGVYEQYLPDHEAAWTKPDNNDIRIRATGCHYCYRGLSDGSGSLNSQVNVHAEVCEHIARFRGSTIHLSGYARGVDDVGVRIDGCENAVIALQKIEGRSPTPEAGIHLNQCQNVTVLGTQIRVFKTGIRLGESWNQNVTLVSPEFDLITEYPIDAVAADVVNVYSPNPYSGDETGTFVRDATGGVTLRMDARHADHGLEMAPGSHVQWLGTATDEQVRAMDAHEGMSVYNADDGSYNIHDGDGWRVVDSTPKDV